MTALTAQQKESLVKLLVEGLKKNDPAIVRGCMERGCDPLVRATEPGSSTYREGTAWAMYYFSEKCADEIFNGTVSVNARDNDGETPLFTAIRQGKPDAVEYLMKRGANPMAQNKGGTVAADLAVAMRTDAQAYRDLRDRMIRALTGPVVEENSGITAQFNPASVKDVKVMKPIILQQKPEDEVVASNDDKMVGGKTPGFKL